MKIAFVRFTGTYGDGTVFGPKSIIVQGEAAESHQKFIDWEAGGTEIVILEWFEVSKDWENRVAGDGCMYDALQALLALDKLGYHGCVSDLLATIFEEGYRLAAAQKKE